MSGANHKISWEMLAEICCSIETSLSKAQFDLDKIPRETKVDGGKICLPLCQLDCVWFCFWPPQASQIQDSRRGSVAAISEIEGCENPTI